MECHAHGHCTESVARPHAVPGVAARSPSTRILRRLAGSGSVAVHDPPCPGREQELLLKREAGSSRALGSRAQRLQYVSGGAAGSAHTSTSKQP